MSDRLRHRGPDCGMVVAIDGAAVFGHRRLSIIDLSSNANQPMSDVTGRYTIAYNGEVYNFQEIRKDLERFGYSFRSNSDTEVVLYSFIHWGAACFRKFNGMFALAIWDSKERELVLARDRFGKKPLYYTFLGGALTFASELTALTADEAVAARAKPSLAALNQFLAVGYILSPLTIYEDVFKLEAATFMRVRGGLVAERARYWEYSDCFRKKCSDGEDAAVEKLHALVDRAVRYRLISDVPVGSFLSGGLDSSGVTAFTKKYMKSDLHTFSVGFGAGSYDESADAQAVSAFVGTCHHELVLRDDMARSEIERCVDCFDEPFSDTSLIPMVEVARLASKHVTVVLSGDGADELFAGYETYRADIIKGRLDAIPVPIRKMFSFVLERTARETNTKVGTGFKMKQFARGLHGDYRWAHYAWRELHDESERVAILGRENADLIRFSNPFETFKKYYAEVSDLDLIGQHLYVDAKTWLVDDILVKIDRSTMASSIEARAPYLDSGVAEYAASLPSWMKIGRNGGKLILKKVLEKYLPRPTVYKKKSGFNAPVNVWLKNDSCNEFKFFNAFVARRKGLVEK